MILLDTNAAIAVLNDKPRRIREKLAARFSTLEPIAISTIVLFELQFGVAKSARKQENAERLKVFLSGPIDVLEFDDADAAAAGELRAALEARGTPIGPFDVLIAGQALRRGATLVTANAREFKRVPGLKLENWAR